MSAKEIRAKKHVQCDPDPNQYKIYKQTDTIFSSFFFSFKRSFIQTFESSTIFNEETTVIFILMCQRIMKLHLMFWFGRENFSFEKKIEGRASARVHWYKLVCLFFVIWIRKTGFACGVRSFIYKSICVTYPFSKLFKVCFPPN